MSFCIHTNRQWPNFTWDDSLIASSLGKIRNLQGRLTGKMESLGFESQTLANFETITLDVLKSSEIEGEILNLEQVRSSIARKLGVEIAGVVNSDRNVDGMVDMIVDATQNCENPMSVERLFNWHAALFPEGKNSIYPITIGNWRTDINGPMQVVSGAMGREKVHFQAPDAHLISAEIEKFLEWFNSKNEMDEVMKAAVAHIWFVTIHPFDDGNGRITRALTDLLLARSENSSQRFYSMSAQIRIERQAYYNILEKTQKGDLDITEWLSWFLNCMHKALKAADLIAEKIIVKSIFWNRYAQTPFNQRQILILNKLFDGFHGKLNTSKWAKIAKCSPDSALRDIQDLIQKGVLIKEEAGGRSTSYVLNSAARPQQLSTKKTSTER